MEHIWIIRDQLSIDSHISVQLDHNLIPPIVEGQRDEMNDISEFCLEFVEWSLVDVVRHGYNQLMSLQKIYEP